MADIECDVAIIGAGTAGLSAERSARRAGARTILIDERFSGTTCASVGCMPSKLLIAASKAANAIEQANVFGISAREVHIDGKAVMRRVQALRDDFVSSTLASIDELAESSKLRGKARFTAIDSLDVDGRRVHAKAVVIATGSRSMIPETFKSLENVLTNETVFDLEDLPASLAVIGAGPLGLELAQAFVRLGVNVEVFDEGHSVAGLKDEKVAAALLEIMRDELPIHLGVLLKASRDGSGVKISWSGSERGERRFSHVLIAAGRPPNLADLALQTTGIALDKHATPLFDRHTMQCGNSCIFLAGDADADVPVLHEASTEGAIAGSNAASYPSVKKSRRSTPLAITFTDPPSVSLGSPPDEGFIIGEASYADQGRAKVEARNVGIARIFANRQGYLTGAEMAVPQAEHMAHLLAWAIEARQTAMDLLELPIYHPTFEEGLRPALRHICKEVGLNLSSDRDAGSVPGV